MNSTSLYAAIDLGSNSFHMLVVREVAGSIQTLTRIKRKDTQADLPSAEDTATLP